MITINRPKRMTNLAALVFVYHIAIALLFLFKSAQSEYYYWASLFVALAAMVYLSALKNRQFIPYEALYVFLGGYVFTYTFPLFFEVSRKYDPSAMLSVMKAAVLGLICFIIGYRSKWGKGLAKALPLKNFTITSEKTLSKLPMRCYFLWAALSGYDTIVGLPPQIRSMCFILINLSLSAGLMIDAHLYLLYKLGNIKKSTRTRYFFRMVVMFILSSAFYIFKGFGGKLVMPVFLVFLVYVKTNKRISIIAVMILALFTVALLRYIVPFTKAFRSLYWKGASMSESVDFGMQVIDPTKRTTGVFSETSISRASNEVELSIVCVKAKEMGAKVTIYKDFGEYIARFVPRFIWPNKPTYDFGRIARELDVLQQTDFYTSVTLPLLGGFILNGGIISVAIGMFITGMLVRVWWDWLIVRSGENFLTFIIYLALMFIWSMGTEDLASVMVASVTFLGYSYVFLGFVTK